MMAEFCLKCWNNINNTGGPESNYIISEELCLCEGCGMLSRVIVAERSAKEPAAVTSGLFKTIRALLGIVRK